MGHEDEAREVEIARRRGLRSGLGLWSKWGDRFLDFTIRYGLKPWRASFGLAIALVFGWILFWAANRGGMMVPTERDAPPAFRPLLYALDVLLPGIDLHQKSQWKLQEKKPLDRLYGFAFVLDYIVWWVSFSLLAAALTGLLKA